MARTEQPPPRTADARWFPTTHWSVVLAARHKDSPQSAEALEKLCRTYWYPLYAYLRRLGHEAHDAQDLTQGFFALLLGKHHLRSVHPAKGKFRSYLLKALHHFLINERERSHAARRGGGQPVLSLDDDSAEDRYQLEPVTELSPDKLFERRWAMTLLDQAYGRLQAEFAREHKSPLFEALKEFLSGEAKPGDYAALAVRLRMTPGAVAVAVHRLRQRYRELVRLEIAHTVGRLEDIDEEMRHLLAVIRG
jgi:RNA polymerase sigma-70 factor (ECF subfamily)